MAKSKSGGTRSYIRGRVGADVYSIGKDAKGSKQQVVRSLAESVANPQTQSQMAQRMCMKTVSEAAKALKPIINHSFDNVPDGQPSISEFMKLNLEKIKSNHEKFNFVKYEEQNAKCGSYIVSQGTAKIPNELNFTTTDGMDACQLITDLNGGETNITFGALKSLLSFKNGSFLVLVQLQTVSETKAVFKWNKIMLADNITDDTVIAHYDAGQSEVVKDVETENLFKVEGTDTLQFFGGINFNATDNQWRIEVEIHGSVVAQGGSVAAAYIWCKYTGKGFIHSSATMDITNYDTEDYCTFDQALATYPVGSERFLNGGDL